MVVGADFVVLSLGEWELVACRWLLVGWQWVSMFVGLGLFLVGCVGCRFGCSGWVGHFGFSVLFGFLRFGVI